MERPTCKTCAYWESETSNNGWCIRHSPTFNPHAPDREDDRFGAFPMTTSDDKCGEHHDFPAYLESLKALQSECERINPLGDLSVRTQNILGAMGVETVGDLEKLTIDRLRNTHNVGRATMKEILEFAASRSIKMKPF